MKFSNTIFRYEVQVKTILHKNYLKMTAAADAACGMPQCAGVAASLRIGASCATLRAGWEGADLFTIGGFIGLERPASLQRVSFIGFTWTYVDEDMNSLFFTTTCLLLYQVCDQLFAQKLAQKHRKPLENLIKNLEDPVES